MSQYTRRKRAAIDKGYAAPPDGSPLDADGWHDAWVRYWAAMDRYTALKAADPAGDHGRPVQPHRSGGGELPSGNPSA